MKMIPTVKGLIEKILINLKRKGWIALSTSLKIEKDGEFKIGKGSKLSALGEIFIKEGGKIIIGEGCYICRGSEMIISPRATLKLGDNVYLGSFVNIRCDIKIAIGDDSLIAQNVSIIGGQYKYKNKNGLIGKQGFEVAEVSIGKNVWIGTGTVVLPGTIIGDGAVIGAGTIVNKNIPAYAIAVGNPARVIGYRE